MTRSVNVRTSCVQPLPQILSSAIVTTPVTRCRPRSARTPSKLSRCSIVSGRLPAFSVLEGAAGKEIQLAHLSFQELLAAEFATAVLQHSHKTFHIASYFNFLSSSSVSCQSRDRLAEQWWLAVWVNVAEMLDEDCFQAWCKEVGSRRACAS